VLTAGHRVILARDEPRVAVTAVVETGTGPLTVTTTHLSFVPGWNGVQLRRVLAALRTLPGPHLLTGDLNIPGALPRALAPWRPLARLPTFPAAEPRVQLDHVLANGDVAAVVDADAPLLPLSDHRALVVELAETSA
jgi:endonuclease/exonuclease/phosphatase (EEP) superfamily protein YafD